MRTKRTNKLLAFLLTLAMAAGLLPTMSFATDSNEGTDWIKSDFERVDSADEIIPGYGYRYIIVAEHLDGEGKVYSALSRAYDGAGLSERNQCAPVTMNGDGTVASTDLDYATGEFPLMFYLSAYSDDYYFLQYPTSNNDWVATTTESASIAVYGTKHLWYFDFYEEGEGETGLKSIKGLPQGHSYYLSLDAENDYKFYMSSSDALPSGCKLYLYRQICEHEHKAFTEAVTPTCTSPGNVGYYYCSDCLSYYRTADDKRITLSDIYLPPTAHNYVDGVCSTCGAAKSVLYTVTRADKRYSSDNYYQVSAGKEYMLVTQGGDGKWYAVGVNEKDGGREAVEVNVEVNSSWASEYTEYKVRDEDIDAFLLEQQGSTLALKGKKGYIGYISDNNGGAEKIVTTAEYLDGTSLTCSGTIGVLYFELKTDESGNYYFAYPSYGCSFVPFEICTHRDGGDAVADSAVEASCKSAGIGTVYKCSSELCNAPYFTDVSQITNPLPHNFVGDTCTACGKTKEDETFAAVTDMYLECDKDYAFVASYNGKTYAMGLNASEKGYNAVEVTLSDNKFASDTATVNVVTRDTDLHWKADGGYLALTEGKLITSPRHDVNIEARWDDSLKNNTDDYKICLIINDGDPYFGVMKTVEMTADNSVAAVPYEKVCKHHMTPYFKAAAENCVKNGMKPVWKCEVCGYFYADEDGNERISKYEWDIKEDAFVIPSWGHIDDNDDDICDRCGAPMSSYQKVTSTDELVLRGKYLLVSEIDGQYYAMGKTQTSYTTEKDTVPALPAVPVTLQEDGTIKYMTAERANAMHMLLGKVDENAFGDYLRFSVNFKNDAQQGDDKEEEKEEEKAEVKAMSVSDETSDVTLAGLVGDYGLRIVNEVGDYKYGFYANKNEDGVVLGSMYTANWSEDSGMISAITDDGTVKFVASSEGTSPAYLYRLIEKETVTIGDNSIAYSILDSKSEVNTEQVGDTSYNTLTASTITNVIGVDNAVTDDAINDRIGSVDVNTNGVNLEIGADVDVTYYYVSESDDKGEGDAEAKDCVEYDIKPNIVITDDDGEIIKQTTISDDDFNGDGMTVTLYTGSVRPEQIVHEKTDGTFEYFYYEWSEAVQTEGKKPFKLSENSLFDEENNYLGSEYAVTFTVTEFSPITVYGEAIEEETSEEPTTDPTPTPPTDPTAKCVKITATYEGGRLIAISISEAPVSEALEHDAPPENTKIFYWESLESMKPIVSN